MRLPRTSAWRRFLLTGRERPSLDQIPTILQQNRFGGDSAEGFGSKHRVESRSGWVSFDNLLDRDLTAGKVIHSGRVFFGLRIDRKRVPANVARARVDLEVREQMAATGRDRLSRKELAEIKEGVQDELLAQTPASSVHIPVVWNVERDTLYFFSNAESAALELRAAFRSSFGVDLTVVDARTLVRHLGSPSWATGLEHLGHSRFDSGAKGSGSSFEEEFQGGTDDFTSSRILGREFLTWLWLESEERPEKVGLVLAESIDLDDDAVDEMRTGLRRGFPSQSLEARAALLAGKKVASARWILAREDREWNFTLKGQSLALSGVRLPRGEASDPHERLDYWLDSVEGLSAALDELYRDFLSERLSGAWKDREREIRDWVVRGRSLFAASTPKKRVPVEV
ncbi:MAG: recombination-associated protein RdgC [Planctomycetota bacterium]|nr:recombination-associated protein RdgC [Planctomycetota bacterium]